MWGQRPEWLRRAALGAAAVGLWYLLDNTLDRRLPVGIIVLGAVFGSLYALTAVGLVLIFRANRVVNFAQAELGGIAAVVAIQLVIQFEWNYYVSVVLGLVGSTMLGALIYIFIIRRFRNAPRLILAVATIGVAQVLAGGSIIISFLFQGQPSGRTFVTPFDVHFSIYPVLFRGDHALAMIAAPVVMIGLAAFLRFTDYGVAIRAAAENGDRANLLGVPVHYLHLVVWSLAAFLSAAAALLRVPVVGFSSFASVTGGGNSLLLRTLAAAVLGKMESIPRTVLAALALGVFENSLAWTYSNTVISDAFLVVIILGALLLQRGFFSRAAEVGMSTWRAIREVRPIPAELRGLPEVRAGIWGIRALIAGFVLTFPLWAATGQEEVTSLIYIYAIVAVSLVILTGWAGHISLGQFALVGFGAAATAVLYGRHGWDFFGAMLVGIALSAVVALVIGLPALRIRGPFLAVTTLAFAVTAGSYFLEDRFFPWFIEGNIQRPFLWDRIPLDASWKIYYFSLGSLAVALLFARNLRHSRTGRALIAVRDNQLAAESVSIDSTKVKLVAFMISGALAGFAGAVYALHQNGIFTGSFDPEVSVRLFSMVVIGGLGSLPGAILGAAYVRSAEFFLSGGWALLASGAGILVLLMFLPEGLGGVVYGLRDGLLRVVARRRGLVVPSLLADIRVEQADQDVDLAQVLSADEKRLGARKPVGAKS
ncbi:MAG TPA: ABC transporter permease [Actinomycetota bacterium]|nr:ABC transporter permease [Actinomycetota bacterium]